jgi:hypothetical protein
LGITGREVEVVHRDAAAKELCGDAYPEIELRIEIFEAVSDKQVAGRHGVILAWLNTPAASPHSTQPAQPPHSPIRLRGEKVKMSRGKRLRGKEVKRLRGVGEF